MHFNSTLEPQWNQFWKFLGGCFSNRYLIKGGSIHIRSGDLRFGRYGLGRLPATSPSPSLSAMARRSLQLGVGAHGWVV